MSIRGKTDRGRSHSSEGNRALDLFTDRQQFTCRFAEYLNDYPPPEKILYFHGGGGNGKSLLLKFLRQKCCKHFQKDIWRELKVKSDAEIAREVEEYSDSEKFDWIPAVTHDFGLPPRGDDRPQDPFYGLLMLRRNLGNTSQALGYPLRFPLFDFACIWYLHQKGKLTQERIKELFPSDALDLVSEIVTLIKEIPGIGLAKTLLGMLNRRVGEQFTIFQMKHGLDEEEVRRIQRLDPDTELIYELPRLLAADLNGAMEQQKAPPRVVLFFDTHEKFWMRSDTSKGTSSFIRMSGCAIS